MLSLDTVRRDLVLSQRDVKDFVDFLKGRPQPFRGLNGGEVGRKWGESVKRRG